MKDYARMSDVQVSKAVGDAIGVEWANLDDNYHELCYWPELDDEPRIFDPCNNPADAWPVITGGGISLIKCTIDSELWSAEVITDIDEVTDNLFQCQSSFDYQDTNPLRAAMIAFLMMNEGE